MLLIYSLLIKNGRRIISSTELFVQLTVYSKWRITQCCAEDTLGPFSCDVTDVGFRITPLINIRHAIRLRDDRKLSYLLELYFDAKVFTLTTEVGSIRNWTYCGRTKYCSLQQMSLSIGVLTGFRGERFCRSIVPITLNQLSDNIKLWGHTNVENRLNWQHMARVIGVYSIVFICPSQIKIMCYELFSWMPTLSVST